MSESQMITFGEVLLIVCAALFFITANPCKFNPKLYQVGQISFGIWLLSAIVVGFYAILRSWTSLGWWQMWVTIGVTVLTGIGMALMVWKTEGDWAFNYPNDGR